jgi:hypothetical protein
MSRGVTRPGLVSKARIFSTPAELEKIKAIVCNYARLPFAVDTVPGSLMEGTLASIRKAEVLKTYDFVDVVHQAERCGWQVKSTKDTTPVTWKRAKIAESRALIAKSENDEDAVQALGGAIIQFCNAHGHESLERYDLEAIGYARLILHSGGTVTYFERELITRESPDLFNAADFTWRWSVQKISAKKEQLSALHGIHRPSGTKWFAWHGRGENQLHFTGERSWWPAPGDPHAITFTLPSASERIDFELLAKLLADLDRVEKEE